MSKKLDKKLEEAIELAITGHRGKTDRAGVPYILHVLAVMNKFRFEDRELAIIAVLHDIVEDTKITLEDLVAKGFSDRVVKAIECLTRRSDEVYEEYINRVKSNMDSTLVKIEDLGDNSYITRYPEPTKKDIARSIMYKEYQRELREIIIVKEWS